MTIRVDADVIASLKETAPQYQAAVSKVLPEYMEWHATNDAETPHRRRKKRA